MNDYQLALHILHSLFVKNTDFFNKYNDFSNVNYFYFIFNLNSLLQAKKFCFCSHGIHTVMKMMNGTLIFMPNTLDPTQKNSILKALKKKSANVQTKPQ